MLVSSPYRYSNNFIMFVELPKNDMFQVLIGILTIVKLYLYIFPPLRVSSPYRYSNNETG